MLTDRGVRTSRSHAEDVDRALARPRVGDHVHVSGYCLLDDATRGAGRRALELAAAAGASRSVDASSAGPFGALGPARFLELVAGADFLFCNLDEGSVLTGQRGAERRRSVAATRAARSW